MKFPVQLEHKKFHCCLLWPWQQSTTHIQPLPWQSRLFLWLFLIGILFQPKYIYAKISSATQIELVSICRFELGIKGLVLLKMRITLLLIIPTLASLSWALTMHQFSAITLQESHWSSALLKSLPAR